MKLIRKTIRRASLWYLQLWESITGKTQQRIHQLQQRLEISQQENHALAQQLQEMSRQLVALRQEHDQSQQRQETSQQHSHTLQQRLQETAQQLLESRQRQVDLEQQLHVIQAQYKQTKQSFNTTVKQLQADVKQSQQTSADFEERWLDTHKNYLALQEQQTSLRQEYTAFINVSDDEIQKLETAIENQQSELGSCYVELGRARAQVMAEAHNSEEHLPAPPSLDLSTWKIAMVGGHENMTRGVSEKLQQQYRLKELIQIPPDKIPQQQLRPKLENCDLIILIIGYINHPLAQSISQLKDRNALKGELLWVNSLGVSGVMREVIGFIETSQSD
ncbi:hypothetical protein IQ260_06875 [Leptolyngbya cf. ectocarpi LEGE 11479]|uniref:DUF2325 domain-containing protein n=1 Tax=Leptolyngbya cf. ectocarpi LEGE 11479 TaxID=1828722 RepID=A0A928ZSK2_LEPEC|nr:hypothetical protein [Leptolyngbya ectocarpi]MBE9066372.1 hypothetical protein [Leptolyngbya cf. ectocarpi LEGE 11479]